jgi:hypothetical protein
MAAREAVLLAMPYLLTIAADPEHLGARIGMISVLHTWARR